MCAKLHSVKELSMSSEQSDKDKSKLVRTINPVEKRPSKNLLREYTRGKLAICLLLSHVSMIGGIFVLIGVGQASKEGNRELLTLVVTTQGAVLGSALGFYFGGKERENE